jgi:hypothetical protein
MEDKILTLHPQGKRGVHISRAKYDAVRASLLQVLRGRALSHVELTAAVEKDLAGRFEGSIAWYMESVKLDLEARKTIRRVKHAGVERYEIA